MAKKTQVQAAIVNRDLMQRMNFLYQASVCLQQSAAPESQRLARKHVRTLKRISTGAVVKLDPSVKRTLCRECNTALVPGTSASIRVKPSKAHAKTISYTCLACRAVRMVPAAPHVQGDLSTSSTGNQPDQQRARKSKVRPVPFFARLDAGHVLYRATERVELDGLPAAQSD